MKRHLATFGALLFVFLLAGCDLTLSNLTPSSIPDNPSRIYTFTARATPKAMSVIRESVAVRIVIDGQSHEMKPSQLGQHIWDFDYQIPSGRDEVAYYFIASYQVEHNGNVSQREEYTDVLRSRIVGRYVLSLETTRGPVGARIGIVGRGFTPSDVVSFDGTPIRTEFLSSNNLAFYVPATETGRNYQVTLSGSTGTSPVGTFRVDSTSLTVTPASLSLTHGQTQSLTFTVPNPAPEGGLLLDVTTDIPDSVIMPEVVVPAGSTSTTVTVEGGQPGSGNLFLTGYGSSGEVAVPVTVR